MVKTQRIFSIEPHSGFTEFDILQKYRQSFERSEQVHLHNIIPFFKLIRSMNLQKGTLDRKIT